MSSSGEDPQQPGGDEQKAQTGTDKPKMEPRPDVVKAAVATAVRIAALCYGIADPGGSAPVRSRVELPARGDEAIPNLCGPRVGFVYAPVTPDTLSHAVVALKLPAGECGPTATVAR